MINVTISESKPQEEKPFPKLMKSKGGRIVFMITHGKGFQLNKAVDDDPHYCASWFMEDLTDYNETITLQNA